MPADDAPASSPLALRQALEQGIQRWEHGRSADQRVHHHVQERQRTEMRGVAHDRRSVHRGLGTYISKTTEFDHFVVSTSALPKLNTNGQ